MKKTGIAAIVICIMGIFSGCLHSEGLLVSDEIAADEYMTDNPQLIEKYGKDYTLEFTGGSGRTEHNFWGDSGEMGFDYIVNGTDEYTVALTKEKRKPWTVQWIICTSRRYVCDEIDFSFDLSSESDVNGTIVHEEIFCKMVYNM